MPDILDDLIQTSKGKTPIPNNLAARAAQEIQALREEVATPILVAVERLVEKTAKADLASRGMESLLGTLLCFVNGVTVWHRHGAKIPKTKLDDLSNIQIEIEKDLQAVKDANEEKAKGLARRILSWNSFIDSAPAFPQRQDSTVDQLKDLRSVANKLGFYDAADYLRDVTVDDRSNEAWIKPPEDYEKRVYLVWFEGDPYCPHLCWPNAGKWCAMNTSDAEQEKLGRPLRVLEFHKPTEEEWARWVKEENDEVGH